jgi:hypothetical protein
MMAKLLQVTEHGTHASAKKLYVVADNIVTIRSQGSSENPHTRLVLAGGSTLMVNEHASYFIKKLGEM